MQRRLAIIVSTALLALGVGSAALVAQPSSGPEASRGPGASQFVGHWMGIDPLDGGDSRRGITTTTIERCGGAGAGIRPGGA
jgi:hypothetical protein